MGMLADAFIKLRDSRAVKLIRAFIRSPWYLALNAFLMVCSELFSLELPVFYIFLVFNLTVFLFDEDMLGVLVTIPCHYMAISAANNPGKHESTMFSDPAQMAHLVVLIAIYAVLFLARLVSLLLLGGKRKTPELTIGFALFGAALMLGGAFSGHWGTRTLLFGFTEFICLAAIYFYFYFCVNWKSVSDNYAMIFLLTLGIGVAAEIIGMYFLPGAIDGSSVNRSALFTGWGIYNNVGCIMAMCLPAPFYFAVKSKEGWIFALLGIVFYLTVLLSQSRNSMLFGTALFIACVVAVLIKAKGWARWKNLIAFGAFALVVVIAGVVFRDRIAALYKAIGEVGFDDSLRFTTYRACWNRFLEAPWFGSGFYYTPGTVLTPDGMWMTFEGATEEGFLPPRAHDTLFQLLASGGVFMTLSYAVHRVQTGILFYRHPTLEKTFLSFSVIALLLTSLIDCHFFNLGPGLLYSALLVFTEGNNLRRNKRSMFVLKDFKRRRNRN